MRLWTALLSHDLWQTHFGGDRTILGRVIRVNGSLAQVVGIAPRTFPGMTLGARAPDLGLPLAARAQLTPESVHLPRLRIVGRLAPGATMAQAGSEIAAVVERDWPRERATDPPRARARPILDAFVSPDVQVSVPLMLQYESVLTRSEHLIAAGISVADAELLLDAIALVARPVRISYLWRPMLPDPDDDPSPPALTMPIRDRIKLEALAPVAHVEGKRERRLEK